MAVTEKRLTDMARAIEMYNTISELEADVDMEMNMPESLDVDLMKKTKDDALKVIYGN